MLTQDDARAMIARSCQRFARDVMAVRPEHWSRALGVGQWSAAHIAEHLVLGHELALGAFTNLRATTLAGRSDFDDEEIPFLFGRLTPTPNAADPSGTWTRVRAIEQFEKSVDAILKYVDTTDLVLRRQGLRFLDLGMMDGVQYLAFTAYHMENHRSEMFRLQRALQARTAA